MLKRTLLAMAAVAITTSSAGAQKIVSAVGGTINSGGPGFGTLAQTYNQSGLSANYVSGVTDFDSYLTGGGPTHTWVFQGNEWFSNEQLNSASVTYDLGAVLGIDKFALWHEDASGFGLLNLLGSSDGTNFFSLASGLTPTNTTLNVDYRAQVFGFSASNVRYVRMDMSRCPQENNSGFTACAIGEVAFRTAGTTVPEPVSASLVALGLLGLSAAARRRRAV